MGDEGWNDPSNIMINFGLKAQLKDFRRRALLWGTQIVHSTSMCKCKSCRPGKGDRPIENAELIRADRNPVQGPV
jgi:hypothetical protein